MIYSIRPIQSNDNIPLAKMIRAVFEEFDAPREGTVYSDPTTDHLFELFHEDRSFLFVAEINSKAVGCCGIFQSKALPISCTELVKFYLAKEYRNLGIGYALMKKSIELAKDHGFQEIYIESLPHFEKAIELYEREGFEYLEGPLGESSHPGCNIWMLKQLS